jgi:D-alanine-D-alanine ligase
MDMPSVPPEWWRTLFDDVYLETDARSVLSGELTRREVDGLIEALQVGVRAAILDLCGGHGRHALELARRGYAGVLVLDFSLPLLSLGLEQASDLGLPVSFVRGDARTLPLAGERFDVVLCLANSFGYGATRQEDLEILRESCRVLRPGGRLFLEISDPEFVRRHLPPQSWHETPQGLVVCRQRWVTREHLVCRELVLSRARGLVRDHAYRLRLYGLEELSACLTAAGFTCVRVASPPELDAGPPERGSLSRRLVLTAWK